MGGWILASNIRQALLGCVTSVLKDEERSGRVRSSSEFLAADHHPQFKWHVEARKVVHPIEFNCRQVMNAVRRFTNKSYDFIQADITTVSCFQRRAWPESTGNYGKQHALKKLFEVVRKRNQGRRPLSPVPLAPLFLLRGHFTNCRRALSLGQRAAINGKRFDGKTPGLRQHATGQRFARL